LIFYEYPFNESIRTMLRLEHLFARLTCLLPREEAVDHHYALATLFEIMDVASRADLKSDLLLELDRQRGQLLGFRGNPSISEAALDLALRRIDGSRERLATMPEGYRHLAYIQTGIGYQVKMDMPMLKGPQVEALYARGAGWLAGGPLER